MAADAWPCTWHASCARPCTPARNGAPSRTSLSKCLPGGAPSCGRTSRGTLGSALPTAGAGRGQAAARGRWQKKRKPEKPGEKMSQIPDRRPSTRSAIDIAGGLFLLAIAAVGYIGGFNLPVGRLSGIGSGLLPKTLAFLIAVF